MQRKVTPFLWFDDNAEEAVNFYVSVFKNAKVSDIRHYRGGAPRPEGSALTVSFEIEGQNFIALNGGPHYRLTPAISLFVDCEMQAEVDELWDKLSEGGQILRCGWLTDRYGLTWQIVPKVLLEMLADEASEKSGRVWKAMMEMEKFDIAALRAAYDGA